MWLGALSNITVRDVDAVSENGAVFWGGVTPIVNLVLERVSIVVAKVGNVTGELRLCMLC